MRQIAVSDLKRVPRKGRRLVGISPEHYKRLLRLSVTTAGKLPIAAVTATVLDLGLKMLEDR